MVVAVLGEPRDLSAPVYTRRVKVDDARSLLEDERLRGLADTGMVELEEGAIQVTALGWYFVRAVALVFGGGHVGRAAARGRAEQDVGIQPGLVAAVSVRHASAAL